MCRTVPLSIIRSFALYTQQWFMSYSFMTAGEQDQNGTLVPNYGPDHNKFRDVGSLANILTSAP